MCQTLQCNRLTAVAVPSDVAKSTVIVFSEAAERVATRFVDAAFSSAVVTSLMEIVGAGSLSVIVTVPVATAIVAFEGFDKAISNVSSASSNVSSVIVAEMVLMFVLL